MSLHLGILYHWSPRSRRAEIRIGGLLARTPSGDKSAVCCGTTPSSAYGLLPYETRVGALDLWQVSVDGGEVYVRGDHAPFVREVRILEHVPATSIWWVAERGARQTKEGE